MERILSIGERLQTLLEDAEKEALKIVLEAEKKSEKMISEVKVDAERKKNLAQRGSNIEEFIREAEEKAKVKADKILHTNEQRAEEMKKIPRKKELEAIDFVLKEVLFHE
jgi:vacuolar-type H+-ATPase subunit H